MIVWLLQNRVQLGRLSILFTIFPLYLATIPLLTLPMAITGLALLLTINYWRIKRSFINFINAHIWLKIQYFWFFTAVIIFGWMVYENVNDFLILPSVVGLLYLIIYITWFNRINTKMTEENSRIILKGETNVSNFSVDIEPYTLPLIFTLMVVFLISSILSLYDTRGSSPFTANQMHWYFPIVILIVHFIIDIFVIEQIEWNPIDGSTTWKEVESPTQLPKINKPNDMALYFEKLSRTSSPPQELEEFIENNLEFLVNNAQNLKYLPFQIQYVRCIENWGREARDHIHLLTAIILASVSQYRFIGLIPLYKRRMFYQTLQAIAMTGSMTTRWRELIEFEVDRKKDEHYVLDWVLGSRYLEFKYHPDWIVTWEGRIYKGKVGYYEAVRKIDEVIQIRPEMTPWELDIWNLCYEYVQVFVGEDSRQILSTNIQFFDQLRYLSAKRTTEEYLQDRQAYKEELRDPSNRLVSVSGDKVVIDRTEEEKRDIINAYLDSEAQTYEIPTFKETVLQIFSNIGESIRNVRLKFILQLLGLLLIFSVNLGVLLLLDNLFGSQSGLFFVVLEVVFLFIFSISPSNSDFKLDDQQSTQTQMLQTSTFSQSAINVTTASFNTATIYLIYGIVLLFSYRYFAF